MSEFRICKKKNSIMIVSLIIMTLVFLFLAFFLIPQFERSLAVAIIILAGELIFMRKAVLEYKAFINISDEGIVYHRGKEDANLTWNDIKRLERSGLPFGALGEMMVIHTTRGKIYIDYNFANYLDAWKLVISIGKEKNPNLLIDHDLKKRVSDS